MGMHRTLWTSGVEALGSGLIGGIFGAAIAQDEVRRGDMLVNGFVMVGAYLMVLAAVHMALGTDDEEARLRRIIREELRGERDR